MADAYVCDHCGELYKGRPSDLVGYDKDVSTWLRVIVCERGEGKKVNPQLCDDCQMAAIRGVLRDMKAI